MDTSEMCVILDTMWTLHDFSGNHGKDSKHGFLDCTIFPFGNNACMGGPMFVDG